MAQLGIPIKDAMYFDIAVYIELIEIHSDNLNGGSDKRRATQSDIDAFLL